MVSTGIIFSGIDARVSDATSTDATIFPTSSKLVSDLTGIGSVSAGPDFSGTSFSSVNTTTLSFSSEIVDIAGRGIFLLSSDTGSDLSDSADEMAELPFTLSAPTLASSETSEITWDSGLGSSTGVDTTDPITATSSDAISTLLGSSAMCVVSVLALSLTTDAVLTSSSAAINSSDDGTIAGLDGWLPSAAVNLSPTETDVSSLVWLSSAMTSDASVFDFSAVAGMTDCSSPVETSWAAATSWSVGFTSVASTTESVWTSCPLSWVCCSVGGWAAGTSLVAVPGKSWIFSGNSFSSWDRWPSDDSSSGFPSNVGEHFKTATYLVPGAGLRGLSFSKMGTSLNSNSSVVTGASSVVVRTKEKTKTTTYNI